MARKASAAAPEPEGHLPGFERFALAQAARAASGFTLAAAYREHTEAFTTRSLIEALESLLSAVQALNEATKAVRAELPHATGEELAAIVAELAAREKRK